MAQARNLLSPQRFFETFWEEIRALVIEPSPVGVKNVADGVVIERTNRAANRLDNGLCSLERIPPGPAIHPLLDNLVTEVGVWDLADNLEAREIVFQVDAFLHRGRDEDGGLFRGDVLLQFLDSILAAVKN